ncbi:MAG TPA: DUF2950 domain-containing protein [Candidatus Eisenbacteria bacterium]|nr:DUF2950 domain-containing protein [Candidatus Eisenbacteria bacterium]
MRSHFVCSLAVALAFAVLAGAADTTQKTFATPADALRALTDATRRNDQAALLAVLGPGSEDIISSGDPVEDRAAAERFSTAARARTRLETLPSGAVIAHVGKDDWPLPIPIVKDGDKWRFDAAAGREELLNRRIGRNELSAINVCRVYVDAQHQHAARERVYAQKIGSDPGKHDGLYWEDPTGKNPSPLGPLIADATAEGYAKPGASAEPQPYHGYFYRILTEQGPNAPGGARKYIQDGEMSRGFALIAYPANYGTSGVMTFIVGPQGIVYQKNLGDKTADLAKAVTAWDPDESWTPVTD